MISFDEAMTSLIQKFTSGNDVPVPQATITREEFEAVVRRLNGKFTPEEAKDAATFKSFGHLDFSLADLNNRKWAVLSRFEKQR